MKKPRLKKAPSMKRRLEPKIEARLARVIARLLKEREDRDGTSLLRREEKP